VTPAQLLLTEIADTAELRLDAHHYLLGAAARPYLGALTRTISLAAPFGFSIQNGLNLQESAYDLLEPEPAQLYASVGALSLFALRKERCTALRDPATYNYRFDVGQMVVRDNEVLLTRSGTPGIAWPGAALTAEDPAVLPSGFLIRISPDTSLIDPVYLAAVLNHPVWRVWSASLAAGKRQRNLSQEHLATVPIPLLPMESQISLGRQYMATLGRINEDFEANRRLFVACDEVLVEILGYPTRSLMYGSVFDVEIPLAECERSAQLRLDARYHRPEHRFYADLLDGLETVCLADLLKCEVLRGRQPRLIDDGDEVGGRIVATVSLQGGQIIGELTKPAVVEDIEADGARLLEAGDLLVAMDGEGSLGKAAVHLDTTEPAMADSHLGVLRLKDTVLSQAVACYLNSSLGQAQIGMYTSGSTGQTQIAAEDLIRVRIPRAVIDKAVDIDAAYLKVLTEYQPIPRKARHRVSTFSCLITEQLLLSGLVEPGMREEFEAMADPDAAAAMLSMLKPSMS